MALLYKFQLSSTFTDNQTLLCDKLLNNECKHKLTHKLFQNARWPSQERLSATCLLLLRSTSPVYIWIWHVYKLGTKFTFPGWHESDPIGKLCASDLLSVRSIWKMVNLVLALFPRQRSWRTQEKHKRNNAHCDIDGHQCLCRTKNKNKNKENFFLQTIVKGQWRQF